MNSTPRTLAAAVAFTTVAAGIAATAPSASAVEAPVLKDKFVAVSAAAYPKLLDRPGATVDVIRFTKVPGATWKLGGTPVTFADGAKTADLPAAAGDAVLTADAADTTAKWSIPAGVPTTWTFAAPATTPATPIDGAALDSKLTWNDLPGTKESLTLPNIPGVIWSVKASASAKETVLDAKKFGAKDSLTTPVTKDAVVTAKLDLGYTVADGKDIPPTFTVGTLTDTANVTVADAAITSALAVGSNPLDGRKGYGSGSSVETVKVTGLPGVSWMVGSSKKAVKVTGVAYLPVDPDDIAADGKLSITAVGSKGFELAGATEGKVTKQLDFSDTTASITVTNADVVKADNPGTAKDTLTLKSQPYLTWYVGQADKKGKIVYKAVKAGKDGKAVYKPTFPKPATAGASVSADVLIKPIQGRGFDLVKSGLTTTTFTFSGDPATVNAANLGAIDGNKVTFTPAGGVDSWAVKYAVTLPKPANKSLSVKAADITKSGATSMTVDFGVPVVAANVTSKLQAGYTKETSAPAAP